LAGFAGSIIPGGNGSIEAGGPVCGYPGDRGAAVVEEKLDFDLVSDGLVRQGILVSPSELHGMLTGALSQDADLDPVTWSQQVTDYLDLSAHDQGEFNEQLLQIYRSTRENLLDPELGFQPLLPDEDTELSLRVAALGEWSAGFLAGFGLQSDAQATEDSKLNLAEDTQEALRDLSAISQVGLAEENEQGDSDIEENYYAEIVEHVRVLAMSVFLDCSAHQANGNAIPDAPGSELLH
jgi:yecA family protein